MFCCHSATGAILFHILKYEADSAAILPFILLYEADFALFLLLFCYLKQILLRFRSLFWYEAGSAADLVVYITSAALDVSLTEAMAQLAINDRP